MFNPSLNFSSATSSVTSSITLSTSMPFGTLTHVMYQTMVCVRWGKKVTDGRTNGQGDSRSRIVSSVQCDLIHFITYH